jgi:hypothetical protein
LRTDERYIDIANFIRQHLFDVTTPAGTASIQRASSVAGSTDAAISEASTDLEEYVEGSSFFQDAIQKVEAVGNPWSHIRSWTAVTGDIEFIGHLLSLYFSWEHPHYVLLSENRFLEDLVSGRKQFCSELLVNAILALACAFSDRAEAREDPEDHATAGSHFFEEAERLLNYENMIDDVNVTVVQALAVMGIREGGYYRDVKGFMYCSRAFRLASDKSFYDGVGGNLGDPEVEVRRATYWGLYCLDLCIIPRLPPWRLLIKC